MLSRFLRTLNYTLTLAGLALLLTGGSMWWRQSRQEAALMAQEGRIFLAVSEPQEPPTLPDFEPPVTTTRGVAPSPTPLPTATEAGAAAGQEATATPAPTREPTPNAFPPAGAVPSQVFAPAIGLDAEVVEMNWTVRTDDAGNAYSEWVVPEYAAGWHRNTALPGHGSNTVLSGHHNVAGEVFRDIVNLEPGNEVNLVADGVIYAYIVEEKYIVKEKGEPIEVRQENNRYIEMTPDERLTLVSCWPYETNTHRVIIIARPRVTPPPEATAEEAAASR